MPAEATIKRSGIDFSLPFFPEHLTTLAYVPSWAKVGAYHKLRYSQLYALYLNEQTVFFEELLAANVLPALYMNPSRVGEDLALDLRKFEKEERKHSRWFRRMNHLIDPHQFRLDEGSYVFVPANHSRKQITAWFARKPFVFPCWIWLMLLQEERSISIAKACLQRDSGIEPEFRALHRKHLKDEVDHVEWDLKLVERVWLPMPVWKRRMQAALFGWMMAEFFTAPKRSAKRLLNAWLAEFPDLAPLALQFGSELDDLASSRAYHASLYSRTHTPRCFAWFDQLPEFSGIGRHLLAYERP